MPLYKQDPTNPNNTVPVITNRVPVRKAITPTKEVIYRRPDHVVLNNTGSYAFLYETTGSVGDTHWQNALYGNTPYVTGSIMNGGGAAEANLTPFRLDINPVAWIRTDATSATGDITFVYAGKHMQNAGPQ